METASCHCEERSNDRYSGQREIASNKKNNDAFLRNQIAPKKVKNRSNLMKRFFFYIDE